MKNRTHSIITLGFMVAALLLAFEVQALFGKKSDQEVRDEIIQMRKDVLARLYNEKPSLEDMIAKATGYAVFSNVGINVLLVSTANGKGIARDNGSGEDIYMNMFSAGGGIGLGVKKFAAVFVLHNQAALDQFIVEGWNFTGQADAAATTDKNDKEQPGSVETAIGLTEGVTVYQMTEAGLALQATLQGTKYWQSESLN
jgi:lipid-binding SYLF domain-containing protein